MGLMDEAKGKLGGAVEKAKVAVDEHSDQIEEGIDKLAGFVDDKTGRKHTGKIDKAAGKAKTLVEKQKKDDKNPLRNTGNDEDGPGTSPGRPPTPGA